MFVYNLYLQEVQQRLMFQDGGAPICANTGIFVEIGEQEFVVKIKNINNER